MASLARTKAFIRKWEGGYVNHPLDTGGATNSGITLTAFMTFYGKHKTIEDLKNLTEEQWDKIFVEKYYIPSGADRILDSNISLLMADMAWGSGVKITVKKVQRLLGVDIDGIVGKQTLGAINNYPDQKELFLKLKEMRREWYCKIVENNPSQKVFLKGWMNRLNSIKYE